MEDGYGYGCIERSKWNCDISGRKLHRIINVTAALAGSCPSLKKNDLLCEPFMCFKWGESYFCLVLRRDPAYRHSAEIVGGCCTELAGLNPDHRLDKSDERDLYLEGKSEDFLITQILAYARRHHQQV